MTSAKKAHSGKLALITSGSSGIGAAMSTVLNKQSPKND